ncbi:Protease 3 precursor [Poriferisphaera corsica]|uniref:Protease 3 n=1 Tax=Poriferisphaera corsica TaxID=2528020 RepID=A0A517YT98_9BACT|nr:pitrilysin family protein [Poriferisphaera corsica]QDU33448.1 Protease 3 precursor [Poriferisphaera corsica]
MTIRLSTSILLIVLTAYSLISCTAATDPIDKPASASNKTKSTSAHPLEKDNGLRVLQNRQDRLIVELPNRMIVIAQEVPTAPVISVQTWIKTGSVYEQEHVGAGLSHFLEHLLSGGTTATRPESESSAILGSMGAQTNAATSLDTVRYYINTTNQHTETAIDLLSDWMQNSSITDEEYARERDVIQREFDMGKGEPSRIMWKLSQKVRYEHHPAKHPTIGYIDEFLKISRDEIYDFYKRMYVPNNMVFVVVGDIDKDKVVEQITNLWRDQPTGQLPEIKLPIEQEITGPKSSTGYADIQRTQIRLMWPGTQLTEPGDYELDLLAKILGQGESSRLVQTIRDQDKLVTSISAYNASFPWGKGFFGVDAEIASEEIAHDQIKQAILDQITLLRDQPVTDEELARAKRLVLSSVLQSNQTAQGIASTIASDTIGSGDPDYLQKYATKIQSLTQSDIQNAAQRFLNDNRLILVTLEPQKGEAPNDLARDEVKDEKLAGIEFEPVDLDNSSVINEMIANFAKASNDVNPIEVDKPVHYTLDNGLRVIVQRSTVVPAVSMNMYWKGGLLAEKQGEEGIANAAAMMLTRGTTSMTSLELSNTIENLGAGIGAASGRNTSYITSSALKEDWKQVMSILADVVLNPTFPEEEWLKLQPRLLAAIDGETNSWSGELRESFRKTYFGDYPWAYSTLGRKDVVEQLNSDKLKQYHINHLGASNTVLAVVGDVRPEEIKAEIEKLFSDLPADSAIAFEPKTPQTPQAEVKQFATQKPLAAVQIGFGPGITRDNPDYAALQVLSRVMSDFPSGWLEQQLRGKGPGLVYAVGAGNVTGLVPGYMTILFNTSAQQAPEAIRRTMSVVNRAKQGDFPKADIDRAIQKVLTDEFMSKQSNGSLATEAALDDLYGVNDPGAKRFMEDVTSMNADKLREIAQKYLNNPVVVVITDQKIPQELLDEAATIKVEQQVKQ